MSETPEQVLRRWVGFPWLQREIDPKELTAARRALESTKVRPPIAQDRCSRCGGPFADGDRYENGPCTDCHWRGVASNAKPEAVS